MAEIQIVYREGYCDCEGADYCTQCHTQCAGNLGCRMFNGGKQEDTFKNGQRVIRIPFGDCIYAKFKYIYKGMSVKNYELQELDDPYNPHLNCMTLETRNRIYCCEKVILDGKCIYDELPEENEAVE